MDFVYTVTKTLDKYTSLIQSFIFSVTQQLLHPGQGGFGASAWKPGHKAGTCPGWDTTVHNPATFFFYTYK